eukprot:11053211-Alexandrium_andersonii.AAC.1
MGLLRVRLGLPRRPSALTVAAHRRRQAPLRLGVSTWKRPCPAPPTMRATSTAMVRGRSCLLYTSDAADDM